MAFSHVTQSWYFLSYGKKGTPKRSLSFDSQGECFKLLESCELTACVIAKSDRIDVLVDNAGYAPPPPRRGLNAQAGSTDSKHHGEPRPPSEAENPRLANDRWFHLRADQARTFAVISATRRPNARAMARSSGFGCNSPCPPAIVVAPYGVPPRASVWSIPSTE